MNEGESFRQQARGAKEPEASSIASNFFICRERNCASNT